MSEETTNKPVRNDEIDLLDLFNRMGRTIRKWMNSLGRGVLISVVFMIRRWIPLTVSIIIGIIVAYFSDKSTQEVFKSSLILKNNVNSNAEMIEYLNRLHTHCQKGKYAELSQLLNLPENQTKEINDIEAFWVISHKRERIPLYIDYNKKYTVADTANTRMQDRMAVRLITKSSINQNEVRDGILSFINRDSLLQQKNRVRLRQNKELLERLNIDISELDSLQKIKYFEDPKNAQSQKATQMIFLQQQSTQLVYNDIYNLYARRQDLEAQRYLYSDIVTILNDFSLPETEKQIVVFSRRNLVIIFFVFPVFLLAIIANKKKLIDIYNKY